jgi:biopolymer transport protein ExbD
VTPGGLEAMLQESYVSRRDKTLFIMGAGTLRYGEIIGVLDAATGAGVDRVGIVTERTTGKLVR